MEPQLEAIRDQQKESWNNFSPGWRKWDDLTMDFLKPSGDVMIRYLKPSGNEVALDIASGTGEPALTIATILDGGKVFMTDLSEGMLHIAREHASSRGITNVESHVCDVSALPFPDNTFDVVSCRLGFMFFPDMSRALSEMVRVLKPGGRIATAVWNGPEKNFWVTATMGTINRLMEVPAPPPGSPGMFRCAKPGLMVDLFTQVGLKNVTESEAPGKMNTQTTDVYWSMMTEVGAPIVAALSKADDVMKAKIKDEVFALVNSNFPDGNVVFDSSAQVIYGEK